MEIYGSAHSAQGFYPEILLHAEFRPPHFVSKAIKMFCPMESEGGRELNRGLFGSTEDANVVYVEIYFHERKDFS